MKFMTTSILFTLFFNSQVFAGSLNCDEICKVGKINLCVSEISGVESITALYTTPKGEAIEINTSPYASLHEVILDAKRRASVQASRHVKQMIDRVADSMSCSKGRRIVTVEAPVAAQYFKD